MIAFLRLTLNLVYIILGKKEEEEKALNTEYQNPYY